MGIDTTVAAEQQVGPTNHHRKRNLALAVVFTALTALGVGAASRYALLTVVLDGLAALVILGPPILAGLWLVPLFRLGPMPLRWHFLLGAGLGLGAISLLVLLLGIVGALHPLLWKALLCACAAAGLIRARKLLVGEPLEKETGGNASHRRLSDSWAYLWLPACPFLVLALLAASNAPGFIWQEEGFGYDVLEYHLQLPKEYLDAGGISYVPHNVYANFPANVEMQYLLAMIVHGNTPDIGTVANMIHLMLAVLAVCAAWVAGREWSPQAGVIGAVAMATVGWLPYLSGLAYVENGMLFFGVLATAALLQAFKRQTDTTGSHRRWLALAGVMAGFACGCKYTALPMIAFPLGLSALMLRGRSVTGRIADGLLFGMATMVTFSPWLIKNQVMTGNPVFPLMNTVFNASPQGWGSDETELWNAGHTLQPDEQTAANRMRLLWQHVLNDEHQRFGPAIFLIAIAGVFARRLSRVDAVLLLMLLVQLAVWLLATHLYARFAVVMLIPLALLAARSVDNGLRSLRRTIVVTLLVAGSVVNIAFASQLHIQESQGGAPASLMYEGKVSGFEYLGLVNHDLPPNARILLVGEARGFYFQREIDYCVAFNRNPFFELLLAEDSAHDVLAWLREQGYTHVLVHWGEIGRVAASYGLSPEIDQLEIWTWFDRLANAGLIRIHGWPPPGKHFRFVDLYEVPHEHGGARPASTASSPLTSTP